MKKNIGYMEARDALLRLAKKIEKEYIPLEQSAGRILAEDVIAKHNVPPFNRSPYDGYAFKALDTVAASSACPVRLRITEEIAAGQIPTGSLMPQTAVKIMTGAPVPFGADAVLPFEQTEYTDDDVCIFSFVKPNSNIIFAGEDVCAGQLLAEDGRIVDAGLAGALASQGKETIKVYRQPLIGIISTGNEITELRSQLTPGRVYDSNRYILTNALKKTGCNVRFLGHSKDDSVGISELIEMGVELCDAVIITGGVSVGKYDLTPQAMEKAGADMLIQGVNMKPGMACAYGHKNGKLICGLSGNPAASITNFCAIILPAMKKICGYQNPIPASISVLLADDFPKESRKERLLRGKIELKEGIVKMHLSSEQGNAVISSAIGCNIMAIVPAGSGPLQAGTMLQGFLTDL